MFKLEKLSEKINKQAVKFCIDDHGINKQYNGMKMIACDGHRALLTFASGSENDPEARFGQITDKPKYCIRLVKPKDFTSCLKRFIAIQKNQDIKEQRVYLGISPARGDLVLQSDAHKPKAKDNYEANYCYGIERIPASISGITKTICLNAAWLLEAIDLDQPVNIHYGDNGNYVCLEPENQAYRYVQMPIAIKY